MLHWLILYLLDFGFDTNDTSKKFRAIPIFLLYIGLVKDIRKLPKNVEKKMIYCNIIYVSEILQLKYSIIFTFAGWRIKWKAHQGAGETVLLPEGFCSSFILFSLFFLSSLHLLLSFCCPWKGRQSSIGKYWWLF